MAKVRNLSDNQQEIAFTEFDFYQLYVETFKTSELGRIKSLLPLREMAISFGLMEEKPKSLRTPRGRKPFFSPEGKVALAFLKMYTGLSAPKLLEALNGNIHYQIFCGVRINPQNQLTNYKLIDNILLELSKKLKIQEQQKVLADAWKPYMKNLDTVYTDASCYESLMRFPTDVKLLWECAGRAYKMMCDISSHLGEHRMRTKYNDIEKVNLAYRKQRKHSHKQTRKMIMRQLALLEKILGEIRRQMRIHSDERLLNDKQLDMLETITRVYRQQKNHFKSGDSRESIPNRIVSLSKPHIRPIVRGKETKTVEFGAKCNNILIDGISFIEKLSFNAFNEGTRLKHCVSLSKKLTGVDVKKIGGDQSYSGNDNRTFCKENGIETSFTQKGRSGKNEVKNATKRELARVRATAMEGSFGTQKEHYGLRKIAARIKSTEILLIFFGIIDYLQYGRKESDSKKVFLSFRPPYGEMTPNSVHSAIVQAFHGSGIDIKKRHHGGHALRFSLAQRMLDRSTPIPIISETLGHQEVDMTRTYVRIDFTHIRQCVLDVPEVSDDFYLQKGGCFYDE